VGEAPRELLLQLFRTAVEAVHPRHSVPKNLPPKPHGRTIVVGAGKAAAAMAAAVEANWRGPLSGLVVTRYGHGAPCRYIEVVEAGHPVPDRAGLEAAGRILQLVQGLTREDLVLCLVSGGGSSLLAVPAKGVTLADKQAVTRALLKSGAPISEMNCVRKHLSGVKGGRLALAAYPAKVVSLIISDVPGDDPAVIASGPTAADPTTSTDALAILRKYDVAAPAAVTDWLNDPSSETPKPGEPRLARVENHIIATAKAALEAAALAAEAAGYTSIVLGDAIEGEARDVARDHAALALRTLQPGQACALISGGETTVTVKGTGRGGRNAEYLLALALTLDGNSRISAIACDTDGIDGTEDNAGAIVTPDTLARAKASGMDAHARLANNDAYGLFHALDDLIVTGPTRTNVNDFRAILIEKA
jgi:hydroxypyruvate reductase